MPGEIKEVDGYKGTWGGKVVAKSTTKRKAMAQQRLLHGVERGWVPTGRPSRLVKTIVKRAKKK